MGAEDETTFFWGPEAIEAMGCLMDGMILDDLVDFPTE
jgi:hypothetical protein